MVIKDKTLRTNMRINNWKIELAIFFGLTQIQTVKWTTLIWKKKPIIWKKNGKKLLIPPGVLALKQSTDYITNNVTRPEFDPHDRQYFECDGYVVAHLDSWVFSGYAGFLPHQWPDPSRYHPCQRKIKYNL